MAKEYWQLIGPDGDKNNVAEIETSDKEMRRIRAAITNDGFQIISISRDEYKRFVAELGEAELEEQ